MAESLWGEEFVLPEKPKAKKILEKIEKKKRDPKQTAEKVVKSKKISFSEKLATIKENVYRVLGKQIDNVITIRDKDIFYSYLDKAIRKHRLAVDTETNNSLDPITCKIVGLCLYVDGEKQAYIPINHRNPDTKVRLEDQLTEEDIKEAFEYLFNYDIKYIYHNGKFDYQVLKCKCNIELPIDWDTLIGAKLLNENERSAGLKQQYIEKIDPEQEKYSIEKLFDGLLYEDFPPELFALYAATDSMMTDKLYLWQKEKFELYDNKKLYELAKNVEMPLVKVVAEMELNGVEFDKEYDDRLSKKYHKLLDDIDSKIATELESLKDKINAWRLTPEANFKPVLGRTKTVGGIKFKYQSGPFSYWYEDKSGRQLSKEEAENYGLVVSEQKSKNEQLEDPINLGSPTQLAILFYDVLKCPQVSKKSPRGTGEEELKALSSKMHLKICDLLLERRELFKLISSFIDSLPNWVNPKTGRIHCHFNAYGAATGRFSSSEPNLQQIPSHNHELRLLFKAADGNILISSDFSQQEPRLLSQFAHDENMINAYKQGKDLYATIAAGVYHNKYEDNLEFNPLTKQLNPEGKERRNSVKSLLLGIMYGRGVASIAEQIHGTKEQAQAIIDNFYRSFPKVKKWIDETQKNARKNGYVEDLWGRRRRLPDLLLDKYQFKDLNETKNTTFNPFLECEDRVQNNSLIDKYKAKLEKIKSRKEYESIQAEALKNGIEIHDNTGFIAQAERQCVNARIQGSAATMTKIAMINLYNNKRLKELGFKLLIGVHDELIGECPLDNRLEAAELLTDIMKKAASDICEVPFKCDAELSTCWYLPQYTAEIEEEFDKLLEKFTDREAFEYIASERTESTRTQLYEIVKDKLSFLPEDIDLKYKSIY